MRIHNLRFGLATNSSSTHSLIFLEPGAERKAHDDCESGNYGWKYFTLKSQGEKAKYLAIMVRDQLVDQVPDGYIRVLLNDWLGTDVSDVAESGYENYTYVDHQSRYTFPLAYGHRVIDEEFIKEVSALLRRSDVAVLGGNDNDDRDHPLLGSGSTFSLPLPQDSRDTLVCRKDEKYGYWAVFNRDTGTKVRFSLSADSPEFDLSPEKSYAPELVDLKITDYCPIGCPFCYQSSTTEGGHSKVLESGILEALGEAKVFEVAIGGGEPTLHPDFTGILKECRKLGMVPNFTTKSLLWLKKPDRAKVVLENCGAFAFSVSKLSEAIKLMKRLSELGVDPRKVNLQLVMGVVSRNEFKGILSLAEDRGVRVTLLGFKHVGFGAEYEPDHLLDYSWWLDVVQELKEAYRCPPIGIDTALASDYREELNKKGVSRMLYETQEGKFSCYIDAVTRKIGPSSYCNPSLMKGLHKSKCWLEEDILEKFAQF